MDRRGLQAEAAASIFEKTNMVAVTKSVPADAIFRALSDRTRLRILCLLRRGELCVCDLVSALEVPQPTASRHLAALRRVGLVRSRKEGTWCYYRLATAATPVKILVFGTLEAVAAELPEAADDAKRLEKRRPGNCG